MQIAFVEQVMRYVRDGGWVMGPLVLATFVLWAALGWRAAMVRRGSRLGLRVLLQRALDDNRTAGGIIGDAVAISAILLRQRQDVSQVRGILDEAFGPIEDRLARGAILAKSIVMVAPLTGLLGTVTGMIETFDALADMALFSQSGGIAGGISQALITTQMGLAIAIPGLIAGRILERKQALLLEELDELKALVMAWRGIAKPRAHTGARP
ncbi:MAG: MotA/TolQ/ExbB proton channel family protein [Myxococcota bacterium]|nr:MotA/TolQ/ExbB proton channel family protein [Myxococcota bacterium]